MRPSDRVVWVILAGLLLLDLWLVSMTAFWPSLWFEVFHGIPGERPPFFARTGAQWAGFALVQALALWRWRGEPGWLAAVAGVRLCDVFADWTYLWVAQPVTPIAWLALVGAGLGNLALAILLFRAYRVRRPSSVTGT